MKARQYPKQATLIKRIGWTAALAVTAVTFVGISHAQQNAPRDLQRTDGPRLNQKQLDEVRDRIQSSNDEPRVLDLQTVTGKHIKYLAFKDEYTIRGQNSFAAGIEFALFREGETGAEQACWSGARPTVFFIPACAGDATCLAQTNRMGSMLLSAKLADQAVTIAHGDCVVREVRLGE